MNISTYIQKLSTAPESIDFAETLSFIDTHYDFTPSPFKNGHQHNEAGHNNASCKILAFARIHGLTENQTLACFGDFYRKNVLQNPNGQDHQNIRQFMQHGWLGVVFPKQPLTAK